MRHCLRPFALLALLAVVVATSASAQTPAPTLETLDAETRAVYETVKPGLLRVQLPPPPWFTLNEDNEFMLKWSEKLAPETRQRLYEMQSAAAAGRDAAIEAVVSPENPPTTRATTTQSANRPAPLAITRPDGGVEIITPGSAPYDALVASLFPKLAAIVVDDQGHAIIPVFIAPEAIGDQFLTVTASDGTSQRATVVGADRQTNLTLIKLERPMGKPVQLLDERPREGSLVMLLPIGGEAGRLIVWTGGQRESGVVVSLRGGVSGFALYGRFLTGASCTPIISQLTQYGKVRRATLGVLVVQDAAAGESVVRIERVLPGSAALAAGMKAGDVIIAVAGATVKDLPNFGLAIARSDGPTDITVLRGAEKLTLKVELRPK